MIKKLLFASLMSTIMCTSLLAQQDSIAVGSNSGYGSQPNLTNNFGPMKTIGFAPIWNRHAYIYPSSMYTNLANNTSLLALAFSRLTTGTSFGSLTNTVTFKIYLKNTTQSTFGSGSLNWSNEIATATLVYDGQSTDIINIVGSSFGLKKFNFSTPFVYTGGNIELLVEYSQTNAPTGEVVWGFDNATTIPAYLNNQVKYTSGVGLPISKNLLDTSQSRHPAITLYFASTGCTGKPNAGTIKSTANVCFDNVTAVSASGYTASSSVKLQWQQSSSSTGPFANVTGGNGDTTSLYITPKLQDTTYYRLKLTCLTSGDSSFTAVAAVNVTKLPTSLPFIMGFNTNTPLIECLSYETVRDTTVHGVAVTPAVVALSNTSNGWVSNIQPQEGDRLIRFNSASNDSADVLRGKFPSISTKGVASVDASLWYYQCNGYKQSNDKFSLQYSIDNGTTWQTVANSTYPVSPAGLDSSTNGWKKLYFTLPAACANIDTLMIGLLFESGHGYDILIDDIRVGASGTLSANAYKLQAKSTSYNQDVIEFSLNQIAAAQTLTFETALSGTAFTPFYETQTTTDKLTYSAIHNINTSTTENRLYRVKITSANGKISYSDIALVKANSSLLTVYPNPAKHVIQVSYPEKNVWISICNMQGQEVMRVANYNGAPLSIERLQAGYYQVRMITQKGQIENTIFYKP